MNVVVLLKQTFDTEEKVVLRDAPANGAKSVDAFISDDGVKFIINPYDEYGVEEAIRIKENLGGKITLVSVGPERTTEALRTGLAMGADEAVLIRDDRISSDEYAVSRVIAAQLATMEWDVILGGNFAVDSGSGQVAIRVAALLGIPHVSAVTSLTIEGNRGTAVRDAEGDTETIEVGLPALFTAQQGLNDPRYPSLPGIMKAKKKPLTILDIDALGLTDADISPKTETVTVTPPPVRQAGQLLQGDAAQQASAMAELLLPKVARHGA